MKTNSNAMDFYGKCYETYACELFSYGLRFGLGKEVLQDLVQDVFLHFFELGKEINGIDMKYYLLCCLKNRIITFIHKEDRHQEIEKEMLLSITNEADTSAIENKEDRDYHSYLLKRLFGMLTCRQKKVIYLRYIKEYSYEEAAGILHVKPKEVRKLTYRALIKMKKGLNNF